MSRVNVYANIRAEGREQDVSIGGRSRQNWIKAWFNTATKGRDVPLSVTAEVLGQKDRKVDERKAYFTIELPPAESSENFDVEIVEHNNGLKALARFGAALVTIKGLTEEDEGKGQFLVEQAAEILDSLKLKMDDVPENVTIMGKNLRHLLACEMMVTMMLQETEAKQPGDN